MIGTPLTHPTFLNPTSTVCALGSVIISLLSTPSGFCALNNHRLTKNIAEEYAKNATLDLSTLWNGIEFRNTDQQCAAEVLDKLCENIPDLASSVRGVKKVKTTCTNKDCRKTTIEEHQSNVFHHSPHDENGQRIKEPSGITFHWTP